MFQIRPHEYLKEGAVVDYYKYHDMPWVSKSRVYSWRKCKYGFKLEVVYEMEQKSIDGIMEMLRDRGTNGHLIFSLFFKVVKDEDLIKHFMKMPLEINFKNSQLYYAFYDICNQIMPQSLRGNKKMQMIVSNFAEYQTQYWLYLSQHFGTYRKIYNDYWMPCNVEEFLEWHGAKITEDGDLEYEGMWYGTLDALYKNPSYWLKKGGKYGKYKYILIDWKTGNAQATVKRNEGIPTDRLMELHFYAWLVSKADVRAGTETVMTLNGEVEMPIYEKVFPDVESYKDLMINMVFLGEDRPYYCDPRTPNKTTMENVFGEIKEMRDAWVAGGPFPRSESDWNCKMCPHGANCVDIQMRDYMEEDY